MVYSGVRAWVDPAVSCLHLGQSSYSDVPGPPLKSTGKPELPRVGVDRSMSFWWDRTKAVMKEELGDGREGSENSLTTGDGSTGHWVGRNEEVSWSGI